MFPWVDISAVLFQPKIEMRPRRAARRTDFADDRALSDSLAPSDQEARQVQIHALVAAGVFDPDHFAVRPFSGREGNPTCGHRLHRGSRRRGIVDATVKVPSTQNWMAAIAERRADPGELEGRTKESALRRFARFVVITFGLLTLEPKQPLGADRASKGADVFGGVDATVANELALIVRELFDE